jgi:RNA polymerase sigma-70 factor (ECF subfamily)
MSRPAAAVAMLVETHPPERPAGLGRGTVAPDHPGVPGGGAAVREPGPAVPVGPDHRAMAGEASDEELIARVAGRDHAAFRALMARHMRRAIRIAQGILGNAADADEVAQETFLRVWGKAGSFDAGRARFTTWMHQIAVNLAIDRTRRPRTEPIELAAEVPDGEPDALVTLMEAQERRAMHEALARLGEHQRAAITLFHFEGLSGRDSAQAMSLSESAFESLLTRARAALKQHVRSASSDRGRRQ